MWRLVSLCTLTLAACTEDKKLRPDDAELPYADTGLSDFATDAGAQDVDANGATGTFDASANEVDGGAVQLWAGYTETLQAAADRNGNVLLVWQDSRHILSFAITSLATIGGSTWVRFPSRCSPQRGSTTKGRADDRRCKKKCPHRRMAKPRGFVASIRAQDGDLRPWSPTRRTGHSITAS